MSSMSPAVWFKLYQAMRQPSAPSGLLGSGPAPARLLSPGLAQAPGGAIPDVVNGDSAAPVADPASMFAVPDQVAPAVPRLFGHPINPALTTLGLSLLSANPEGSTSRAVAQGFDALIHRSIEQQKLHDYQHMAHALSVAYPDGDVPLRDLQKMYTYGMATNNPYIINDAKQEIGFTLQRAQLAGQPSAPSYHVQPGDDGKDHLFAYRALPSGGYDKMDLGPAQDTTKAALASGKYAFVQPGYDPKTGKTALFGVNKETNRAEQIPGAEFMSRSQALTPQQMVQLPHMLDAENDMEKYESQVGFRSVLAGSQAGWKQYLNSEAGQAYLGAARRWTDAYLAFAAGRKGEFLYKQYQEAFTVHGTDKPAVREDKLRARQIIMQAIQLQSRGELTPDAVDAVVAQQGQKITGEAPKISDTINGKPDPFAGGGS